MTRAEYQELFRRARRHADLLYEAWLSVSLEAATLVHQTRMEQFTRMTTSRGRDGYRPGEWPKRAPGTSVRLRPPPLPWAYPHQRTLNNQGKQLNRPGGGFTFPASNHRKGDK